MEMVIKQNNAYSFTETLLQEIGITINGSEAWDIKVHHRDFFNRVLKEGSLGLGESYMAGWWDCENLDQFIYRIIKAHFASRLKSNKRILLKGLLYRLINMQNRARSLIVGRQHYDLGVSLFQAMLDRSLNYSCGYWLNASDLDQAQQNKMALVCRKLMLKPGMRLLDIGCGFGSLAKYAAMHHGVKVVGITISHQQAEYAQSHCGDLPIEIRFQDYRDISESFDRVVSIGMFEHVGALNYSHYFKKIHSILPEEGIFLLHTIGRNVSTFRADEWISKYIFPNGMLPSITQIGKAIENLFVMEDWHNFGADYDRTLMAWYNNFQMNWDQLKSSYDHRFYRMWRYYLLACAGVFRARDIQLWQVVLSKNGILHGYHAPR